LDFDGSKMSSRIDFKTLVPRNGHADSLGVNVIFRSPAGILGILILILYIIATVFGFAGYALAEE